MKGSGSGIREAQKHTDPDPVFFPHVFTFMLCPGFCLPGSVLSSISKSVHKNKKTAEVYVLSTVHCIFVLCFSLLNSVREFWQNCGIWSRIEAIKAIFIEPQRKDALTAVMKGTCCNKLWSNKIKHISSHNHAPAGNLALEPTVLTVYGVKAGAQVHNHIRLITF
jgi:hypothetical protein